MDKLKILNYKIWIVLAALIFGTFQYNETRTEIKDLLDLNYVLNNGNKVTPLGINTQTGYGYVDRITYARVELLEIKLMTELVMLMFGLIVLLDLLEKKGFSIIGSIQQLRGKKE